MVEHLLTEDRDGPERSRRAHSLSVVVQVRDRLPRKSVEAGSGKTGLRTCELVQVRLTVGSGSYDNEHMSSMRLQVLVPPGLDARIRKAAQRDGVSKGEWVRGALEAALKAEGRSADPLTRLSSLGAPTGDIDQMLAEIEAGRS